MSDLHASLVDIGRRLDALDVRLGDELDRLRRGESDWLPSLTAATGVTLNFRVHNSDHRGALDTSGIEEIPAIQLSFIKS